MLIIGWASLPITVIIDYKPTVIVGEKVKVFHNTVVENLHLFLCEGVI